jgi:uncharacterized protein Yka (UPF0111/DUF47 family)
MREAKSLMRAATPRFRHVTTAIRRFLRLVRAWLVLSPRVMDELLALSDLTLRGAELLLQAFQDYELPDTTHGTFSQIKIAANKLTEHLAVELSRASITPIDCEDMNTLAIEFDKVIDRMCAAGDAALRSKLPRMSSAALQLCAVIIKQSQHLNRGLTLLRSPEQALSECAEISRVGREAQTLTGQGIATLFTDGTDPMRIVQLKGLYDDLKAVSGALENAANVLEGIVFKSE